MAFVNYKNTNNASSLLISDITASATTILITDGDQNLFPSNFPFLLTLEHLDTNENVILREIVKVVGKNQNTFTVERSAGTCVQDDTATNRAQDNTAHAFYSGDRVSLYWTAEQVQDIQNNLELKANQDAIANVYDSSLNYAVGDIVVYKGDRYQNTTAVSTPEEFDPTKRTKVNVQYDLNDKQSQIDTINDTLSHLGGLRKVDVLVLGGGGGGGGGHCATNYFNGGGGGAGQLKVIEGVALKNDVFSVVVGNGGNGGAGHLPGNNGGASKFGKIVAIGGGGGGGAVLCASGCDGGNGGGEGATNYHVANTPYTPGVGDIGGHSGAGAYSDNNNGTNCLKYPGGGGGTGGNGGDFPILLGTTCMQYIRHIGGTGTTTNFGGTKISIGGGGSSFANTEWPAVVYASSYYYICQIEMKLSGKNFGGGTLCGQTCNGCPGKANTGGGGGGGGGRSSYSGGAGGSGLVIVRYPTDCSYGIKTATGGTITTATIDGIEYKVHTFTSNGTFCITESV